MSATENMTPQEAAQVMRRWADAVEALAGTPEGQAARDLQLEREENGRLRNERSEAEDRAEKAEGRVEELEAMRGSSGLRSISGEVASLSEELAAARSQRDTARAEAERLQAALDGAAEECEELQGEAERLRAELDDLRAATPRTTRPSDVQTGQSVAWFSVEDMQWRVRRIKSGPDAVGFSISQMFNPHQKVVILGEPPRELDQEDTGDEADPQPDELDDARAERDEMVEGRWNWRRKYVAADAERTDLRAANERQSGELEATREALRRANQETRSARSDLSQAQRDLRGYMRRELRSHTAVRPVLRPDEWKAGQVVAARPGSRQHRPDAQDRWTITTVGEQPHGGRRFIMTDSLYIPSTDAEDVSVVLLEDAPERADDEAGDAEAEGDDWEPLPDEPDAVIEAVEFNGAPMAPQLARKLGRHAGRPFWWSLVSGDTWPDGSEVADPEEITGWRWPAEGGGQS